MPESSGLELGVLGFSHEEHKIKAEPAQAELSLQSNISKRDSLVILEKALNGALNVSFNSSLKILLKHHDCYQILECISVLNMYNS